MLLVDDVLKCHARLLRLWHTRPRLCATAVYATHPGIYFPWNLGLRFSAKAVAASRWCSVLKVIISYAIDASRIKLTCCLSHLFTDSLVHRIAQVGPSANSRAIPLALDSTWSSGTA